MSILPYSIPSYPNFSIRSKDLFFSWADKKLGNLGVHECPRLFPVVLTYQNAKITRLRLWDWYFWKAWMREWQAERELERHLFISWLVIITISLDINHCVP